MPEPDPLPAIKTPWGSATPPTGAGAGETPPIPIPDHTLIRRIGKGSYGEVWLARNALGVYRAVKVIHRGSFDDNRPFEREFAGMQRFEPVSRSHESQLNILQVGRGPDYFYYVMELADDMGGAYASGGTSSASPQLPAELQSGTHGTRPSETLNPDTYTPRTLRSELLLRGRLPVDECVRLGLALTTALEHLHRNRLVHRDIKPSNIVFVNGIPKLADIGLVAQAERTMSFVGTEGYLPPEGPGTVPADLFSLGKVLYEIGTGHDRQQFPELPTNVVELPDRAALAEFNEVLVRACAPDVKQRYQTAAEMHADLALLQSGKSVSRMRVIERRLRVIQRAGAFVAVAAILILSGWFYQVRQTGIVRELANQKTRLAEQLTRSVNDLRYNVYAADMKAAQIAWRENNVGRARDLLSRHFPQSGEEDLRGIEWRYLWLASRGDELRSFSHPEIVNCGVLSPDGKLLGTGSFDHQTRIWDATSGSIVVQFDGLEEDDIMKSAAFSPDGKLFASGRRNGIDLRETARWQIVRRLEGGAWPVVFSPDGNLLAVAVKGGVRLWNTANWESIWLPTGFDLSAASTLAFSSDSKCVAAATAGVAPIQLWNIPSRVKIREFTGMVEVRSLDISPLGRWLAAGDRYGRVAIWDLETGRVAVDEKPHISHVLGLAFSPDGQNLATGGEDHLIHVWRLSVEDSSAPSFQKVSTLRGHWNGVWSVRFSPDGHRIVSAGKDGMAKTWPVEPRRELRGLNGLATNSVILGYSADGKTLRAFTANRAIEIWDLRDGKLSRSFPLPSEATDFPIVTDDGMLVFGTTNGTVLWWNAAAAQRTRTMTAGQGPVSALQLSPDGRFLFTFDSVLSRGALWEVETGRALAVFTDFTSIERPMRKVAFSPDSRLLAYASKNVDIALLDLSNLQNVTRLKGHRRGVAHVSFSPDGRLLVSAGADHESRIWEVPLGQEALPPLRGHTQGVNHATFSPDGRTLFTTGLDGTRLWSVATGREMLFLEEAQLNVPDIPNLAGIISPDGNLMAWRRQDGSFELTRLPLLSEIDVQERAAAK